MKRVRFHEAASAEYLEGLGWYAARNVEVARRFRQAVRAAVVTLRERPRQWPLVPTVAERLGARRVLVQGFPYSLVYLDLDEETVVIAVAHGKRRPGYWRDRGPGRAP